MKISLYMDMIGSFRYEAPSDGHRPYYTFRLSSFMAVLFSITLIHNRFHTLSGSLAKKEVDGGRQFLTFDIKILF